MTYNPTPDRSAEIIANAGNNTAQITAQGNANFQNQLTSSFNTAMGMLSKNVESKNADAAKANTNAGTGQALDQVYKTYGTPEQRQDFLLGLEKVSGNQDKTAGYLAMHQQTGQSLMQMAATNNQYDRAYKLAKRKAALNAGGPASNPYINVEMADGIDYSK